jgi:hypothetical protein
MKDTQETEATKLTIASGIMGQAERDAGEGGISPSNQLADDTQSATVKERWGKVGPQVRKWIVKINFATMNMASIGETQMVCPSCQQLNIVIKCKRKNMWKSILKRYTKLMCLRHLKKKATQSVKGRP